MFKITGRYILNIQALLECCFIGMVNSQLGRWNGTWKEYARFFSFFRRGSWQPCISLLHMNTRTKKNSEIKVQHFSSFCNQQICTYIFYCSMFPKSHWDCMSIFCKIIIPIALFIHFRIMWIVNVNLWSINSYIFMCNKNRFIPIYKIA